MPEPGVYVGTLRHRRFRPRAHAFTYPIFLTLLDVDRLGDLLRVSPFTAYNRANWASFHDADHLDGTSRPLRERLREDAARAGVLLPDGQVLLLTHLRYLGYVFNPVSFYYCFDAEGRLAMVMAEVNNTFGGRQTYWLTEPTRRGDTGGFSFRTRKTLFVSPFLPLGLDWTFFFSQVGAQIVVHMTAEEVVDGSGGGDPGGEAAVLDATLRLDRRPWTAGVFLRTLIRFPFMTARVIAAIHWQALRLYLKRVPVFTSPTPDGVEARRVPGVGAPTR